MLNHDNLLNDAPLGKSSPNISHYQRDLLFRIPRQSKREEIGITDHLPFSRKRHLECLRNILAQWKR